MNDVLFPQFELVTEPEQIDSESFKEKEEERPEADRLADYRKFLEKEIKVSRRLSDVD